MASRQEQKEQRRRERQQREQEAARQAARKRRLRLVGASLVAILPLAAIVVAVLAARGGDDPSAATGASPKARDTRSPPVAIVPPVAIADLAQAAKAAGCVLRTHKSEGREHLSSETATFTAYRTDPPTSGTHRPSAAEDGIYAVGNPPAVENGVHSLEHGRVTIQYRPSLAETRRLQLEALASEPLKGVEGYHQLLFENTTNMPFEVAATAWTQTLGCSTMNAKTFDAIRAFRTRYVDKGPELIP